jgi:hypothetical protein
MMRMRQSKARCRLRQRRIRQGHGAAVDRCRPAVVARALREGKELHLGSLRGTLDPQPFAATFAARGLARYDAEPTPLPVERRLLLVQLEAFPAEVRQRLS